MNDIYAAFRSRREALAYAQALSSRRVYTRVIGTPARIGGGCGLSVRFPTSAASVAEWILASGDYESFLGFYRE